MQVLHSRGLLPCSQDPVHHRPPECEDSTDPSHERVEWFLLDIQILHPNVRHEGGFRHVRTHEQVHEASLAFRPIGSRP